MRLLAAATVAAALGLAAASPALAATLKVPSETYPTIQSAVDAASDGDTISVARGTYNEIVMVMDKTNLVIRGRAKPVLNGPGAAFTVTGGSGVTITGFQIEGGGGAVSATMCSGLVISKMTVSAPTTVSFDFIQCAGVTLTRCAVSDGTGTVIQDQTSTGLRIEKCRFANNTGGDLMRLSPYFGANLGSNGAVVAKNRVEGGETIIRFAGTDATIEKNTMLAIAGNGIAFDGTTDTNGTVVSKNKVETTGGGSYAIQVYEDSLTLSRNRVTGGGIYMQGNGNAAERNVIRSANSIGIASFGQLNGVVGNQIVGGFYDGINCQGGAHSAEGNKVIGVDGSGIVLQPGTAGSLVGGNRVTGCDGFGIAVMNLGVIVAGNKASGNGVLDYADSQAAGVNTLDGNRFGTMQFSYMF